MSEFRPAETCVTNRGRAGSSGRSLDSWRSGLCSRLRKEALQPHGEPQGLPRSCQLQQGDRKRYFLSGSLTIRQSGQQRCMLRIVECNHLIDGGDLFHDSLDPERQFLDFAKQICALSLQFLFNSHVAPLQQWSRKLPDRFAQVWWHLLPNVGLVR